MLHGDSSYHTGFTKFDNTKVLNDSLSHQKFWIVAAFLFAFGLTFLSATVIISINPFIALLLVVCGWVLFGISIKKYSRAKKMKKQLRYINSYLQHKNPGTYAFSEIQKGMSPNIDSNDKEQIFGMINQMPQYDASIKSDTIVKRL